MHATEEDTAPVTMLVKKPKFSEETKKGFTNAEKGSIIHTVLEHLDFSETVDTLPQKTEALVQKGILTAQEAAAIDMSMLAAFVQSPLFDRMRRADALHRETPFTYLKPCGEIIAGYAGDAKTMVQGIIDCWFTEGDNVVLVDYKTDRIASGEELVARYRTQLMLYDEALERITGKRASEIFIYSLYLKEAIALKKG